MGFFDSIRKAFDTGGIAVELRSPDTFRWSEGTLPVTVTITGDDKEPRTITAIELKLAQAPVGTAEEQRRARKPDRGIIQRHEQPIALSPGETATVELAFALNPAAAVEGVSGEAAPGWLTAVGTAANVLSDLPRETPWYRLEATPEIEGFTARKTAARRIKNLRAGEWGDGRGVSGSIGIG